MAPSEFAHVLFEGRALALFPAEPSDIFACLRRRTRATGDHFSLSGLSSKNRLFSGRPTSRVQRQTRIVSRFCTWEREAGPYSRLASFRPTPFSIACSFMDGCEPTARARSVMSVMEEANYLAHAGPSVPICRLASCVSLARDRRAAMTPPVRQGAAIHARVLTNDTPSTSSRLFHRACNYTHVGRR